MGANGCESYDTIYTINYKFSHKSRHYRKDILSQGNGVIFLDDRQRLFLLLLAVFVFLKSVGQIEQENG